FARPMPPQREVAIARFRFNAWAKYPEWKQDDRIPERVAAKLKLPLYRARGEGGKPDIVLEGGAIDVNGRGTLLTTEQCLLDPAVQARDRKSTRLNSSHEWIAYAVFCLIKKRNTSSEFESYNTC